MISKKLNDFIEKAKLSDTYWVEKAKLDYAIQLDKFRKFSELSNKDLASKLGTSAAYISKIFRGESNLTIESMVKTARAANAELQISLIPNQNITSQWVGRIVKLNAKQQHKLAPVHSTRTAEINFAANEEQCEIRLYG
jgi:transcriptional regulator with XRE-family HTH domain